MKIRISKATVLLALPIVIACCGLTTSCSKMLSTDSEFVQFAEDNTLDQPEDTIFSMMGVIRDLQVVADRLVLLGELRGDLVVTTDKATKDLKNLAAFNFSEENKYNSISDFYAVINDCNFFIANADMYLERLGKVIFEREFAAIKTYRAWTYLQMAKIYGAVPLVLDPVLTESDAQKEMQKKPSDIYEICDYFLDDIAEFIDTELPQYGNMGSYQSSQFFIPVRVLMGELSLWMGYYEEAIEYLADYLTLGNNPITTGLVSAYWNDNIDNFATAVPIGSFGSMFNSSVSEEVISMIPMEENEYFGVKSYLPEIFNSVENTNYGFFQVTPSQAMSDYSAAEDYCYLYTTKVGKDTIYVPKDNLQKKYYAGDLRFCQTYTYGTVNRNEYSKYSSATQNISKHTGLYVVTYRRQQVYLMLAEALNRAGFPESAMCVLKYGLTNLNMARYISEREYEDVSYYLFFNDVIFTEQNTQGIHSRGCGEAECDTLYVLPMPETALASYEDTVAYQIPLVEDMIMREMTLEKAFEGQRYYDLMRIALRRGEPEYLAKAVASRSGKMDADLFSFLSNPENWYLPIETPEKENE